MPFVLIPCIWNRYSARFQQVGNLKERVHGDGMLIDFDSSEALEEVLWKVFWLRHYKSDRIIPWYDEENNDFAKFFRNHMRKIILVRRRKDACSTRYVSKNNLNIARIHMLRRLFPGSTILVPFRQPLQHATSLLKQHINFFRIHVKDKFVSDYMRAIGHYDFGDNFCPVDFDGWIDERKTLDAKSIGFWIEYWVATYRHLLEKSDDLFFFSYEGLCENSNRSLHRLAKIIDCKNIDALLSAVPVIHRSTNRKVDTESVSSSILKEADFIYEKLRKAALL